VIRRVAVVLAALVLTGACGGNGTALDGKGAKLLQAEVAAARAAAGRGDSAQAADLLQTVVNTVEALRRQDKVSDARRQEILDAVGRVRAALPKPAPTTVSPPTTNAPAVSTNNDQHGDNGNDGRGRKKGKKHGDG
jgi:hypothetical protein